MSSSWGITDTAASSVDDGLCFGDIDADGDLDVVGYTEDDAGCGCRAASSRWNDAQIALTVGLLLLGCARRRAPRPLSEARPHGFLASSFGAGFLASSFGAGFLASSFGAGFLASSFGVACVSSLEA